MMLMTSRSMRSVRIGKRSTRESCTNLGLWDLPSIEKRDRCERHCLEQVGEPVLRLFFGASLTDNANTSVVKLGDKRVVCLTKTEKGSIMIDPETLETMGKFKYNDSLGGLIHSAHPVVTLLSDMVRAGYLVVRMEPGTNERRVIGLHPVASAEVPLLVTFHFTNVYEEEDEDGRVTAIIADCCEHNSDPTILDRLRLQNLRSFNGECNIPWPTPVPCQKMLPVVLLALRNGGTLGARGWSVLGCRPDMALGWARGCYSEDVLHDARVGRFRIPLDGTSYGTIDATLDPNEHGKGMNMLLDWKIWYRRGH
ncbi:Carotenoid oxygenase [Vigna unguiculata]|uniref:Carotenoid oxygenase n=1 Tax=Vigna unguiculata TaxID=3917 RepID=A0A4D6M2R7_VIGUN|nr:Carotenoid oxygenase [Vigna unguiculata]